MKTRHEAANGMMLIDTSVWIEHLRRGNRVLASHLEDGQVFCHPFVIGELACRNLHRRSEILSLLGALPQADLADHSEVMTFIETNRLMGRGIGWVDVHLLCSARLTGAPFWTLDRRLAEVARSIGVVARA